MATIKTGRLKIRPSRIKKVNSPDYLEDLTFILLMKKLPRPLRIKAGKLYDKYSVFRGNVLKRASMKRTWVNFVIKNTPKK